jgi:hypothetical protein
MSKWYESGLAIMLPDMPQLQMRYQIMAAF